MNIFLRLWHSQFVQFVFGAAFEGVRVMRREPKAVLSWIAVWLLVLAAIAIIKVLSGGTAVVGQGARGAVTAIRGFGPLAAVLIPALLVLWIMTNATAFRSVIRPDEHGWHLFKLGPDEARLAVTRAVGFAMVVVFGGAPALVLFVLAKPVLMMAPGLGRGIVDIGAFATVCLEFWIATRLSLASVHTFAEGRFHVAGYWRLTHGRFWRLLVSYLVIVVEIVFVLVAFALVALLIGWAVVSIGTPHGADIVRRAVLLGLALALALNVATLFFVIPTVIVCACQAFAYRAIISRPWG